MNLSELSNEEIRDRLCGNPHLKALVGIHGTVGYTFLLTALEWRYFRPNTVRNQDFVLIGSKYKGVLFITAIFDPSLVPDGALESLLKEADLTTVPGPIKIFGGEEDPKFPIYGNNVLAVRYPPGHKAYGMDLDDIEAVSEEFLKKIEAEYGKKAPEGLLRPKPGRVTVEELFNQVLSIQTIPRG